MTEPLGDGDLIHADAALTAGGFELFEMGADAGEGPPLHVHKERDEAFYVLEGSYRFWRDSVVVDARRGEFVFVPRGSRHRFEARRDGSRLLFVVAPAGLEGFFREVAALVAAGTPPLAARVQLSERYDSFPVIEQPGSP